MKQVTYEKVIGKQTNCVIIGDEINKLRPKSREKFRFDCIKDGVPMTFTKINTTIKRILGDNLLYIKFWEDIKIYRVEE